MFDSFISFHFHNIVHLYDTLLLYRVAQNLGKQVLRTHFLKFDSLSSDFAVFTHGERDLHSLTLDGWISCADLVKIAECCFAVLISSRMRDQIHWVH